MHATTSLLLILLLVLAVGVGPASAHLIVSCPTEAVTNPPNTRGGCLFFNFGEAENDPVPDGSASLNTLILLPVFSDETKPVDVEFFPEDFPPTDTTFTEYVFTHAVFNNTAVTWTDYHIQLGTTLVFGLNFTLGTPEADFDVPDGPFPFFSDVFTTATLISDDEIRFSGGVVPPGTSVTLTHGIDIRGDFALRQFPTVSQVPAPATLGLLTGGALGLSLARRWRVRRTPR